MKYLYTNLLLTFLTWAALGQAADITGLVSTTSAAPLPTAAVAAVQPFSVKLDLFALSQDGNTLASVDADGQIKLLDTASNQVRRTLPSRSLSPLGGLVFSPGGDTLASVGRSAIQLWNVAAGNIRLNLPQSVPVNQLLFSPDGKTLATLGQDNRITLWDSTSGAKSQVLSGHKGDINAITFSPDSKILASGGQDGQIKLWAIKSGLEQANFSGALPVTKMVFSQDGKTLAAVGQDARIALWDVQSGLKAQVLSGHQGSVDALAFNPVGKILASGGQDGQIKLWDRTTGQAVASLTSQLGEGSVAVIGLAFSRDGKRLSGVTKSQLVFLWDVSSVPQKPPQLLAGHKSQVDQVAFSIDQKSLVSVGKSGQVVIWNLATGLPQLTFDAPVPPSLISSLQLPAALTVSDLVAAVPNTAPLLIAAENFNACSAPANQIIAENCLAGNLQSEWDVVGAGDLSIQGFTTDISLNRGGTVSFKINTDKLNNVVPNTRLDIYRMGYYNSLGARKVATLVAPGVSQPACLSDAATGLTDCGNWSVTAAWPMPANLATGIYFAKVVRTDTGGASHIPFIVRDDNSHSALLFQTSDTTWQAYNDYGGNSLYVGAPAGRAYKVSYNRPLVTRGNQFSRASLFGTEYPMVRWLEANGYDLSYFTGTDTDRSGAELLEHKLFLSVGHDEYWSAGQRANVEAARNAGIHLGFFSGNEMFWKIRWEAGIDGAGVPYRTLVSYKETKADAKIDPLSNVWTGTWRDPRFSPPADGGKPENQLTSTLFTVNCCQDGLGITVPEAYSKFRLWRNTSIATLAPGALASLPSGTLGYEWDEPLDNGFMPGDVVKMSSTPIMLTSGLYLLDFGNNFGPGTATHSLTLYKHSSGAWVFGAGTIRWSWGLDGHHDPDGVFPNASTTPDIRMQQATVNLLADMGVQPQNLQTGLVAASQSTDTVRPTSSLTSPPAGSTVQSNVPVEITGTATDTGGGIVAGVEVSVDGGATWQLATGRESWRYAWVPGASGSVTLKSRAIDDSGNQEVSGPTVTVTVTSVCPCNIWPLTAIPATTASSDNAAVELGVKFKSDVVGNITGIRFYKGATNTGTHVGKLWSSTGQLMATATFSGETATGWQQVNFSPAVAISANTVYMASYFAPNGGYAFNGSYFATKGFDNAPLHALQEGVGGGNGVFLYGAFGGFPADSFKSGNYWVDVVFAAASSSPDTDPPTAPTGLAATATGASQVSLSWAASTDNVAVTGYQVERCQGAECISFLPVGTPTNPNFGDSLLSAGTTYLYRVRAKDAAGNFSAYSGVVPQTTLTTTATVQSIWPTTSTPLTPAVSDTSAVELGVKFKSDVAGNITGVRFYKGTTNTGTHVGKLWSITGQLLATANFVGETATGWQQANFSPAVAITAGTVYVASYFAPNGGYAFNGGYFATQGFDNAPLHALQNGVSGGNGVYVYGATGGFPTGSFNSANYWVDVIFN